MLNSIKLFIIVSLITIGSSLTEELVFNNVEGGTPLIAITVLGIFGMIASFIAVLIEIHHNAVRKEKE